jgi:ribonucleoside-triphosphate reductase
MNEALINFLGENLTTEQGINFVIKTLNFMREKLEKYQEETEHMYNLEATPSESTAYSLALKDKKLYPDIIVANESDVIKGAEPYYTNSTQLPVDYTDDPFEAAEKQEEIQSLYTGGTVLHFFLGERLTNGEYAKIFVKKILENFKLPYITLTPTFSICPKHGYIPGEYEFCPYCDEELAQGKDKKEDINKPEFFVR